MYAKIQVNRSLGGKNVGTFTLERHFFIKTKTKKSKDVYESGLACEISLCCGMRCVQRFRGEKNNNSLKNNRFLYDEVVTRILIIDIFDLL